MKPICTAALPTVFVNNTVLKIVSHHKYLGVVFDDKLQWSSHIDKVCKSMSYYLYMIGSHCTSLTQDAGRIIGTVSNEVWYLYVGTSTPAKTYFTFTKDAE